MYHQNSCLFYNRIAYDRDYSGLSTDDEEGMRTAKQLGEKSVLFMCNHGVLVVAPNAARAIDDMYYLERACMTQVTNRKLKFFRLFLSQVFLVGVYNNIVMRLFFHLFTGSRHVNWTRIV